MKGNRELRNIEQREYWAWAKYKKSEPGSNEAREAFAAWKVIHLLKIAAGGVTRVAA